MNHLKAFIAGFISTLVFHQGLLGLLYVSGIFPRAPFAMNPVGPLGVPSVISLAFWGGVWGVALWLWLRRKTGAAYWQQWALLGALGPTIVALFVVFPLKGLPLAGGWSPSLIIAALLLNGVWGLGVALLLRYMPGKR